MQQGVCIKVNDRNELINTLKKIKLCNNNDCVNCLTCKYEEIADCLLNNVIVAPMPMAEWLRQELTEYVYKRCMEEL